MSVLHEFTSGKNPPGGGLNASERFSVFYHNLFEYPLTFSELVKWTPGDAPEIGSRVEYKNGYYFIEGKEGLVYKRTVRKRFSLRKRKIAERVSKIVFFIPGVKMVAISGSLAMDNAGKESDIDLIFITKKGRLWTTRIAVYMLLKLFNFRLRKPLNLRQKDRLCLNIWLDESDLTWSKKERNFYTAHEILQIVPLVDRGGVYERFLSSNKWALKFWPNAAEVRLNKNSSSYTKPLRLNIIETLSFKIQYFYMKHKITREVVTPTRAIFHPNNLSKKILSKIDY